MTAPRLGKSSDGRDMHYSVGTLIEKGEKYLLIDRAKFPFGFAGVAGHIDDSETPVQALIREVREECGLEVKKHKLLFEEELDWNKCSNGIGVHYWHLFSCEISGKIKWNSAETKSIGWYGLDEMKKLKLEPVWEYWFKKLKLL